VHETLLSAAPPEFPTPEFEHLVHVHVGLGCRKPVCQTTSETLRHALPAITSSAAWMMALPLFASSWLSSMFTAAAARFTSASAADQLHRHALAGNAEVLQAALGLRAPQAVGRDLDLAEGIALDSRIHRFRVASNW